MRTVVESERTGNGTCIYDLSPAWVDFLDYTAQEMSISYLNTYAPSSAAPPLPPFIHLETAPELYDFKFTGGPIYPLHTNKVSLFPFIPSLYARQFHEMLKGHAEMMGYMPYVPRPWESLEMMCQCFELLIRRVPVGTAKSFIMMDRCTG